jgi:hypothetical protein
MGIRKRYFMFECQETFLDENDCKKLGFSQILF